MKVKFNKKLDKEVYLAFCDAVVGGVDFGKKICNDHPNITKKNYIKYIDNFYITDKNKLESVIKNIELCFDEIKEPLFLELRNYFGNNYIKEKYTCHPSIFDCNPRYLKTKTFQVYYKYTHSACKEIIAHEITHFVFYDFCREAGIKDSNDLWELSEIFNVIFLNFPSIQKAIGAEELLFYPDLKDKLKEIKNIWMEQLDPVRFIKKSLKYLKSLNSH